MDREAPVALLGVHGHVGDRGRRIVFPEEQLARVVRQRDALHRHLEVDLRGDRQRPLGEQHGDRLADGLGARQTLRLDGAQEHHVARGALVEQLPLLLQLRVQLRVERLLDVPIRDQQATRERQGGDRVLVD